MWMKLKQTLTVINNVCFCLEFNLTFNLRCITLENRSHEIVSNVEYLLCCHFGTVLDSFWWLSLQKHCLIENHNVNHFVLEMRSVTHSAYYWTKYLDNNVNETKNLSKGQNIYLEITWLNRTEEYINSLLLLLFYKIFLELFIKNESCFSHIQIPRTSFNVFLCSYFLLLLIKKKKLVLWRIENTWINCIALVLCGMEILECYKTHFSFCFFFFCGWIWIGIFFFVPQSNT